MAQEHVGARSALTAGLGFTPTTENRNMGEWCNCIECIGDQPEMAPEMAPEEIAEYEAHEKAVYDVALWLMAREGQDEGDPHELLYSGGPIPEPWGERWQKWEDDARQLVALVKPNVELTGE